MFIRPIHGDTFEQNWVADTGIHKAFKLTILSTLLRLNVWEGVDAFALKILNSWCFVSSVFL